MEPLAKIKALQAVLLCKLQSDWLLVRAHTSRCFYSLVFYTPLKIHILHWLSQYLVSYVFQPEFSACFPSC